jgi:hypothetical protein
MHVTRKQETDRKEAWRNYEMWQLRRKIILATYAPPPPNYAEGLLSPDYLPPPGSEWPPLIIEKDPASGFRIIHNRDKERG